MWKSIKQPPQDVVILTADLYFGQKGQYGGNGESPYYC
jgi:hypothetical protein